MKLSVTLLSALGCILLLNSNSLLAQEVNTAQAKKVIKDKAPAVIRVLGVIKRSASFQGKTQNIPEAKFDAVGLVINPEGMTLVSLTAIGARIGQGIELKSTYSNIRLRLTDGTEIPAKISLEDPELDVAFLKPEPVKDEKLKAKVPKSYPHFKLESKSKVELLDTVISMTRLDGTLDYQPSVDVSRVQAIVKKPRNAFQCGRAPLGGAILDMEGNLVGIALRVGSLRANDANLILTVDEIAETAKQATGK